MADPAEEALRLIAEVNEAAKRALRQVASVEPVTVSPAAVVQPVQMADFVPRPELDAKLEAMEARMETQFARLENQVNAVLTQVNGFRDDAKDLRAEVRDAGTERRSAVREFRLWAAASILAIIGTGVGIQQMTTGTFAAGAQTAQQQQQLLNEIKQIQQDLAEQKKAAAPTKP